MTEMYRRPKGPRPNAPAHIRKGEHLRDLAGLLDAVEEHEPHVPCRASDTPSLWISSDPADVLTAVVGCQGCPVMELCATYIERWPEPTGTWAGRPAKTRGHSRGVMPRPKLQQTTEGEPIVPRLKHCPNCRLVKAARHFDFADRSADGLSVRCSECRAGREPRKSRTQPRKGNTA